MPAGLTAPAPPSPRPIRSAGGFSLRELSGAAGLRAQLLPSGAVFALRQDRILINQVLPGPAEDGLFRLLVRWRGLGAPRAASRWAPLVGAGLRFACAGPDRAVWETAPAPGLSCRTTLQLHPAQTAWAWHCRVRNESAQPLVIDLFHAQDLGLADEAAVRNNEAYVSQYLDLRPVEDPRWGPVILARQNQPAPGGRHPWAAFACATGAASFCTDGWQFFGADHRLTAEPAAVRAAALPSQRLQYEFALAGLQSRAQTLAPGAEAGIVFLASYSADHPGCSSAADLPGLHALWPGPWTAGTAGAALAAASPSLFTHAGWRHGLEPTDADLAAWFPGARRHEERDDSGRLLSFFSGGETHVACRAKEASLMRPHGHILRSGDYLWTDDEQFGLTCYAAGIFGAQVYLGNPSLARLLSVVRNQLNVTRASGQRVFVREGPAWLQLGVPSAFAMEPGLVRWIYRLETRTIELRAWCAGREPASFLELGVRAGPPAEFLVTHQLALGAQEFDAPGELTVHEDGWIAVQPAVEDLVSRRLPGLGFGLAAADPAQLAACGGDELLYADRTARRGPYAVFQTRAVEQTAFVLFGANSGPSALSGLLGRVRDEASRPGARARPPAPPLRMDGSVAVKPVDEILPWFTHNAAIHFSAPHGLDQYGGGAWGVRDVCQGSIEWLLAAGEFALARQTLLAVFAQQYAPAPDHPAVAGGWPQWFMPGPFRSIQQTHSHGDVCFWPVKALCDYVEASGDFGVLDTPAGYTDPVRFAPRGPDEPLWIHCERVVDQAESRFIAGTALVNYGDGDWDDTLQPADPRMRTRMISTWTVGLAFQTFRQLAEVARRAGQGGLCGRLEALLARMRGDFERHALPDGVVAGFLVREDGGGFRPLLHPADRITGIRYRLLPMTRSILAGLFTPAEARRHAGLIESELRFADGVRLMSEPAAYHGGLEKLFKRADTAANFGREIGLQYVHAHLRYAEAMARLGEADRLWWALQAVNPVDLAAIVPGAAPRQANVYFSSSDAGFPDRIEAAARWPELRAGRVPVRGGWRLYSSGPGLYLHKLRSCLLGLRESFGDVVFDPVLPRALDGLRARTRLLGRPVSLHFHLNGAGGASRLAVNGAALSGLGREANPYRPGGLRVPLRTLAPLLRDSANDIRLES